MKQPTTENSDIIKLVAILGDFALLNLSMILVFFILKGIDSQAIAHISLKTYLLTSNLCYIPCISIFGVILHNRIVRPEQIVGRLLGTISLHVVIFLTVLAIIKVDNFSRIYLLVFYLSFIPLAIGWRLTLRFFVKMFRRSGRNLHATVLIGDGDNMVELYHTLNDLTYGYRVLGIFYDEKDSNYPKGIPFKGPVFKAFFVGASELSLHLLFVAAEAATAFTYDSPTHSYFVFAGGSDLTRLLSSSAVGIWLSRSFMSASIFRNSLFSASSSFERAASGSSCIRISS